MLGEPTMNGASPSGPVRQLLERLERVQSRNGSYIALCPAHDDTEPSLSVSEGEDGRALIKCFAGCPPQHITDALGLEMGDLFEHRNGVPARRRKPPVTSAPPPTRQTSSCTLQAYAEAKHLPADFLGRLGLSDITYSGSPAARIPYFDRDGNETAVRIRLALAKHPDRDDRFRWRKGSKPTLYGLWRLPQIRDAGYVVLVEGESDCHTLWHHGIEALGIPGASSWKDEWTDHLEGVDKVYAIIEPDQGGVALWDSLAASPLREKLHRVELPDAKDPSELHLQDPTQFKHNLRAAFKRARRWFEEARAEAEARDREAWQACEQLAREGRILDRFAETLERSGVAGESRVLKLLYLALTSRLLDKPVSIAVKGPSSGGKSYLTERVLRFFPESAYHALTAMSERLLAYSEEPIKHRFLVIYEAEGMSGDFATYLIRSLLSEGKVRYETVEKTRDGLKARLIEREGPTGLIVTTTALKLHPENETRLLSLTVTDTQKQTRGVFSMLAEEERLEADQKPWHALQHWLESPSATRTVTIPYAKALAGIVPPLAVRLRRDFGALLSLIRAHAILHQATRERDDRGRLVATLDDYSSVRELVSDLVAEGIEATVPKSVREAVHAVARLHAQEDLPVTVVQVAKELELDRSAASRRIRSAKDRGFLRDLEDNPRKPSRLVPADPLPEDLEILPDPQKLQAYKACTRADESEGIHTPLPPKTTRKRGEGVHTPRNPVHACTPCMHRTRTASSGSTYEHPRPPRGLARQRRNTRGRRPHPASRRPRGRSHRRTPRNRLPAQARPHPPPGTRTTKARRSRASGPPHKVEQRARLHSYPRPHHRRLARGTRLRMSTLGDRGRQSTRPEGRRTMSWYSVTARPLYIELRALGVTVHVQENPDLGPLDYGLVIDGLSTLPDGRSRRLRERILDNEEALVKIVLDRHDPDLRAIRSEASCR
jgi:hypothetical protein